MKLVELADRLGVKIVPGYQDELMRHHPAMMRRKHNEENGFAWLVSPTMVAYDCTFGRDVPELLTAEGHTSDATDDIFHEMMHAVCGPKCLKDEGPLMPVQWELMKLLDEEVYAKCRNDFASYMILVQEGSKTNPYFVASEVGREDTFVHGAPWLQLSYEAKAQSLLTMKGEPNWPFLRDSSKWGRAFGVSGKGRS